MKDSIHVIKSEVKAKVQLWNNIKSGKVKAALIVLFITLVSLKVFTTVLTFDWLADLYNSI